MNIGEVKGRVDFGILTIREDEFRAVLHRFPDKLGDGRAQGRRIYNLRLLALPGGGAYTLAIVRCVEQGNGEALAMARDLLEDLAPRWLLVVGIAGGMPTSEITLGDIVVSTRILDFSVEAVLEGGAFEHAVTGGPVHNDAAALAANLPALDDELGAWSSPESVGTPRPPVDLAPVNFYGDEAWQKKVRESLELHFGGTPRAPRFTAGALASSDRLVKDTERTKAWLLAARQIVAVEMESGGVHRATYGRDVPFLAIRGLSDVVGFRRDRAWTQFACDVAATFARAFLLTEPIVSRSAGSTVGPVLGSSAEAPLPAAPARTEGPLVVSRRMVPDITESAQRIVAKVDEAPAANGTRTISGEEEATHAHVGSPKLIPVAHHREKMIRLAIIVAVIVVAATVPIVLIASERFFTECYDTGTMSRPPDGKPENNLCLGVRDGPCSTEKLGRTGRLTVSGVCSNHSMEGHWEAHPFGGWLWEGDYRAGKPCGEIRVYGADGQQETEIYSQGSCRLLKAGKYLNGKAVGRWKYACANGNWKVIDESEGPDKKTAIEGPDGTKLANEMCPQLLEK